MKNIYFLGETHLQTPITAMVAILVYWREGGIMILELGPKQTMSFFGLFNQSLIQHGELLNDKSG